MKPLDLSAPLSQSAFARLVGLTPSRVNQLLAEGVLPADAPAGDWLLAYCERLREQAAGRSGDGDLVLAQERAALARAQREGVELKNAITRGEYAPIGLLADVLATASSSIADHLDGLEPLLRKAVPDLPARALETIGRRVADARNEWVRATERLVVDKLEALADDDQPAAADQVPGEP